MAEETTAAAISRMEEQIKNLDRRMSNLDKLTETVNKLAISMERLTSSMKVTEENVDRLQTDVAILHDKPGKRWETLVGAIIAAIVGAIIGFFVKGA